MLGFLSVQSQSISGRDFWVMMAERQSCFAASDTIVLYILGDTLSEGTVDNDHYDYHNSFQVIPGQVTLLKIPSYMIMFDNTVQNGNTSFRGVWVHSSHNIFLYAQNLLTVPDTSMPTASSSCVIWRNTGFELNYYYMSPLMVTRFSSEKIPILPVSFQKRNRFPDIGEDWWFYRCSDITEVNTGTGIWHSYYITAFEDSTVITMFHSDYDNSTSAFIPDTDIIILQKNESTIVIPTIGVVSSHIVFPSFRTNCKPISLMNGDVGAALNDWTVELQSAFFSYSQSKAYQGYDYLCTKLTNNRFDKGIHYLKRAECNNPISPTWRDTVDRYMYNELVAWTDWDLQANLFSAPSFLGIIGDVRKDDLITGTHRGLWGGVSSYVSVPYTFLRSSSLIPYHSANGPYFFICKEGGPSYPVYGIQQDSIGYSTNLKTNPFISAQPTDRMVKDWVYPTTRNNVKRKIHFEDTGTLEIDTLYADVQIYVHADGLHTTYFNGQLLPAEVFDSFPMTNGDYYVTQMAFYNEDIPEIIRITNVNGFSAYVDEFGYNVLPAPAGHPEIDDITKVYYYHAGASGCFYTDYPNGSINIAEHDFDTVYRCLGDTLALLVEHNPDSVPVEWIYDGESYIIPGLAFILDELTTHTVQCILHYECPDTTTTFVAVVPPPLITVAHDTIVCAGATLTVEQPDAISYLWSNGSTTPSITVDSAGTFQVSVTNIGCRAESDSFHVSLYGQSAVDFGSDSILCELATLLLDATQPHPAQYIWQDNSTNTTYQVYQDGDYWVVITDNCLGASDTINIGYLNDFTINLGPDTVLCEGKTLKLSAEVPYCDYLWQDGSTQPTYLVRGPGMYSVEVSNKCFSHWDAVNVDYEHCAQEIYLPNAFTPNNDGKNPVFLPIFSYPDEIEEYRMEIYNRWGTLVFRTEEKTFGWDGANAMDGVYAVVIHYKSRGEKATKVTGSVTVVR